MPDLASGLQLDLETELQVVDLELDLEINLEQDPTALLLAGLTNFSSLNYFLTAAGGGEAGIATGFGLLILFVLPPLTGQQRLYLGGWNGAAGYLVDLLLSGMLNCFMADGANVGRQVNVPMLNSDVGKIQLLDFFYDGTAITAEVARGELFRTLAMTGYTAGSGSRRPAFGGDGGSLYFNGSILSIATYRGTPTLVQRQAYYDAARVRGDLPETMGGAAITHRWSVKDELFRVSNPGGRKLYGARAFAAASYLSSAAGGLRGSAAGFIHFFKIRFDTIPSSSGEMIACCTDNGASLGWYLINFTTASMRLTMGATSTPTYTVTAADLTRPQVVAVQFTGTHIRLFVNRVQIGADVAATFSAPTGSPFVIGAWKGTSPFTSGSVFEAMGGDISPTLAQVQKVFDDFDATGTLVPSIAGLQHRYNLGDPSGVPAIVVDTIGTDHLTRTGTLELAVDTASAPAAPLQLTDTVTRATVDAAIRNASPTVRLSDTTADGRRTLGVQGFSPTNYLQTAQGAGLLGSAAGMWVAWAGQINQFLVSGAVVFAECLNTSPLQGWALNAGSSNHANIAFNVVNAAGGVIASSVYNATASDIGVPLLLIGVSTGTALRMYKLTKGGGVLTQVGPDVPIVGYAAPVARRNVVGVRDGTATLANVNGSWFGLEGGDGFVPTLAELQQLADDWERTGQLVAILNKTTRQWLPTIDISASGVDAVPAIVLDRVGTDHLTRVGIDVRTDANAIRAVGPYGAADSWQTAPGGGIQGVSTGYHVVIDVWLMKVPAAGVAEVIAHCANSGASSGYVVQINNLALRIVAGGVVAGNYNLTSTDLNKRLRIMLRCTGINIELYVNGTLVTSIAQGTFVANTNIPFTLGSFYGAQNFSGYVESVVGGNVNPSGANITTYFADLTVPPPTIAGVTLKRWILEQDIAGVSGALPVRAVERISGNDDLMRAGSPLVLAQRMERSWSYETSPILYGATTQSVAAGGAANHFAAAVNSLPGDPAAFGVSVLCRVTSQAVGAASRTLFGQRGATNPGWFISSTGLNSTLVFSCGGASASASPSAMTVAAADVGKLLLLTGTWDGTSARFYAKRGLVGTLATLGQLYVPYTIGSPRILRREDGAPSDGIEVYGVAYWVGNAALAQVQAQHDAVMAFERIQLPPGLTGTLIDLDADIRANGGVLPATLTDRSTGGVSFARQGVPDLSALCARMWGW